MKRFIRWVTAAKQRFVWIFGVLFLGGGCWVLLLIFHPFLASVFLLPMWLVGGYFWGLWMWPFIRKRREL
jgi:hypothetical protein